MNIYAIGLRGWIELREARKRPKAVVTSVCLKSKGGPVLLNSVVYTGGKVIRLLPTSRFYGALNRTTPRYQQMVRMTPGNVMRLKQKGLLHVGKGKHVWAQGSVMAAFN